MPRLRRLRRHELDPEQQELFDVLAARAAATSEATEAPWLYASGPGMTKIYHGVGPDGGLEGPSNARVRSPYIGRADQEFGEALRRCTVMTERMRELVILVVAHTVDSAFERYAHEDIGRAVGVTEAELAALAAGAVPDGLAPDEAVAVRCARALVGNGRFGDGDLDDDLYAEAAATLGDRIVYELVLFVGHYMQIALQLRVFRIGAPEPFDGS